MTRKKNIQFGKKQELLECFQSALKIVALSFPSCFLPFYLHLILLLSLNLSLEMGQENDVIGSKSSKTTLEFSVHLSFHFMCTNFSLPLGERVRGKFT
jgi:hypothetical protein